MPVDPFQLAAVHLPISHVRPFSLDSNVAVYHSHDVQIPRTVTHTKATAPNVDKYLISRLLPKISKRGLGNPGKPKVGGLDSLDSGAFIDVTFVVVATVEDSASH